MLARGGWVVGGGGALGFIGGREARKAGCQASIVERSSLNTKFFSCIKKFIRVLSPRERVRERVIFGSPEVKRSGRQAAIGVQNPRKNKFLLLLWNKRITKFKKSTCKAQKKCYTSDILHHLKNKLCAFTLAEVLITLGIIGVVAALTMPVLIQKNSERAWLTAFKKTYSVLSQAYLMAYQEHGIGREWGLSATNAGYEKFYNIMTPYLKIADNIGYKRFKIDWKDLDGSADSNFFGSSSYKAVLADGTLLSFGYIGDLNMPLLLVDVNGTKGPNVLGKDTFYFVFNDKNGYPVVSGYALWWTKSFVYCSVEENTSAGWRSGGACSTWIIATGNMDYLHRQLTLDEWQKAISRLIVNLGDASLK